MKEVHSGSCLCGGVRFHTRGPLRGVVYCHCTQCRKQTGHFLAATSSADEDLTIEEDGSLGWYAASEGARRGFCRTCGSVLFWKRTAAASVSIMAGAFDTPSGLRGESHIFVADKGDYYGICDDLPQFERSSPTIAVANE